LCRGWGKIERGVEDKVLPGGPFCQQGKNDIFLPRCLSQLREPLKLNGLLTDVAPKGKNLEIVALKEVHEKLGQRGD
jgi:hypothetical protein